MAVTALPSAMPSSSTASIVTDDEPGAVRRTGLAGGARTDW